MYRIDSDSPEPNFVYSVNATKTWFRASSQDPDFDDVTEALERAIALAISSTSRFKLNAGMGHVYIIDSTWISSNLRPRTTYLYSVSGPTIYVRDIYVYRQ